MTEEALKEFNVKYGRMRKWLGWLLKIFPKFQYACFSLVIVWSFLIDNAIAAAAYFAALVATFLYWQEQKLHFKNQDKQDKLIGEMFDVMQRQDKAMRRLNESLMLYRRRDH